MTRGRFITVEGIEGTGKSTNINYLVSLLQARGVETLQTREPGGTPMAERIRELLLAHDQEALPYEAELLLFFAARCLHLRNTILPAVEAGKWVICDRFTDASRAYQGAGRGLPAERIEWLADWVQGGVEPDLTLLLDAPAETGVARARQRGNGDRMDHEDLDFYRRVRQGYLNLAKRYPERFVVVDASPSLAEVQTAMRHKLDRWFSDISD